VIVYGSLRWQGLAARVANDGVNPLADLRATSLLTPQVAGQIAAHNRAVVENCK